MNTKLPLSFIDKLSDNKKGKQYETIETGEIVKLTSRRYTAFKQSQTCSKCNTQATHLSVDIESGQYSDTNWHIRIGSKFHLNLRGENNLLFCAKQTENGKVTTCENCLNK